MHARRLALTTLGAAATLVIVAGCSSSAKTTNATAPVPTATVTQTDTVNPPSLPTGSGVPASSSAPASGSGTSGNASGPGLCTPTVMTLRIGQRDGAAGTSYASIIATNASQQPCTTDGYPGVAALDAAGKQIAQAQRSNGGRAGASAVVQPGQQISAVISGASMATGVPECPESAGILFTLPNNTDSTRIDLQIPACSNGVTVGPMVLGTTGR